MGKVPPQLQAYLFKKGSFKARKHGAAGGRKSRPNTKSTTKSNTRGKKK